MKEKEIFSAKDTKPSCQIQFLISLTDIRHGPLFNTIWMPGPVVMEQISVLICRMLLI